MQHLLSLFELPTDDIWRVFERSRELKSQWKSGHRRPLLERRVLGLLFSKPSLRTRVSFEAAMAHLGGQTLYLGQDVGWQSRESAYDFGRVLTQYLDVIVCRTHDHSTLEQLAAVSACPVINGLTEHFHPCQALADLFTLWELRGGFQGAHVVFVGDGNNVARSLAVGCGKLGIRFTLACPADYCFPQNFMDRLHRELPNWQPSVVDNPHKAVADATAIYTDVWCSMGQEAEADQRRKVFAGYQVNDALIKRAPKDVVFLHCLPARRGEEVTDAVMDGPHSQVVAQAANRMHVQKGILVHLLCNGGGDAAS
jgi:ornithine carbamoyltransferase